MSAFVGRRNTQRGAALILMMTVIVVGIAWYTVGALGKAARSTADRELATGAALYAAKRALLDYVAAQAAQPDNAIPGRLPCPEPLSPAVGSEGVAAGCSDNTATYVGRLPWRTLGVDQIRDGDGELLWYILGPGFRQSPINFGTAGKIATDIPILNPVVAMIIAPGAALNTMSEAGTPPANCPRVNQQPRPVSAPFNPTLFLECGRQNVPVAPALPSYVTTKDSPWSNDRIIMVTANEVMDAIAGPVGDRVQRQVAALMGNWHQVEFDATGRSWGNTYGFNYLPFASDWNNPSGGNFCANQGQDDGLAPVDTSCTAYGYKWSGSSSASGGMDTQGGCSDQGTYLRCRFRRISSATPLTATINATTTNVGHAFRSTIVPSDLTIGSGGSATISMVLGSNSDVSATINVTWSNSLAVGTNNIEVQIPHLQNAAILSDSRYTWFWNNKWHEYTYYAIAPAAQAPGTSTCTPGVDCITVSGLPPSTGATNDKRLVLVLSGRPLGGQSQPSGSRSDYFELENRTTGDREYQVTTISTTFNDRVAACPFSYPTQSGPALTLCN